ncbi:hypothetical protein IGI04_032337 [Brassica rapa subsp. trilocularis]|uniref:Uncharacterized protein n=1 Tax=Brassica rapa subsp. trilocularis TaxID=1813537 RepID=A0ABQ7LW65_BRACM|nr:hypothetical protein IGI04_032337 [Brassica rapa subsp. trilocularis]
MAVARCAAEVRLREETLREETVHDGGRGGDEDDQEDDYENRPAAAAAAASAAMRAAAGGWRTVCRAVCAVELSFSRRESWISGCSAVDSDGWFGGWWWWRMREEAKETATETDKRE